MNVERVHGHAVAAHYDSLDGWYRALWGDHLHHGIWARGTQDAAEASGNLLQAVADAAGMKAGMCVCDVGSGYGGPARWFARHLGVEVVGVTNSARQFESAAPGAGVSFRFGDWLENDLPDDAFDAVVAIESLAHFERPDRALAEMLRVLKPGGRLVVCGWVVGPDLSPVERWMIVDPVRRAGVSAGLVRLEKLAGWVRESGGASVTVEHLGSRVGRTWSEAMASARWEFFQDRSFRREVLRQPWQAAKLAWAAFAIRCGYRLGTLDYVVIQARKQERPNFRFPLSP